MILMILAVRVILNQIMRTLVYNIWVHIMGSTTTKTYCLVPKHNNNLLCN